MKKSRLSLPNVLYMYTYGISQRTSSKMRSCGQFRWYIYQSLWEEVMGIKLYKYIEILKGEIFDFFSLLDTI